MSNHAKVAAGITRSVLLANGLGNYYDFAFPNHMNFMSSDVNKTYETLKTYSLVDLREYLYLLLPQVPNNIVLRGLNMAVRFIDKDIERERILTNKQNKNTSSSEFLRLKEENEYLKNVVEEESLVYKLYKQETGKSMEEMEFENRQLKDSLDFQESENKKLTSSLNLKITTLHNYKLELENENDKLVEDLKHVNEKLTIKKEQIVVLINETEELEKLLESDRIQFKNTNNDELKRLNEELKLKNIELDKVRYSYINAYKRIETLLKENKGLVYANKEMAIANLKMTDANKEMANVNKKITDANIENVCKLQGKQMENQLVELNLELKQKNDRIQNLTQNLNDSGERNIKLNNELIDKFGQIADSKDNKKQLEAKLLESLEVCKKKDEQLQTLRFHYNDQKERNVFFQDQREQIANLNNELKLKDKKLNEIKQFLKL